MLRTGSAFFSTQHPCGYQVWMTHTTRHAGASYTAATHVDTTQNTTIALLKQLREEERREWRRNENRGEEPSTKMAYKKVENLYINTLNIPNPVVIETPAFHPACNISSLSLGTQNPWSSIQHRNHWFQPCKLHQTTCRTYHSFQHPVDNYKYKSPPPWPPAAKVLVIETVWDPYGIGPTKPVVRIPAAPLVPVNSTIANINSPGSTICCHCSRSCCDN